MLERFTIRPSGAFLISGKSVCVSSMVPKKIRVECLAQNVLAHRACIVWRAEWLLGNAGIVDEDIEPAEVLIEVVVGFLIIGGFGDVKADRFNVSAFRPQLLCRSFAFFQISRSDHNLYALLPNCRAVSRPIPRFPPVMNATFFSAMRCLLDLADLMPKLETDAADGRTGPQVTQFSPVTS